MIKSQSTGYWHSESVKADERIECQSPFALQPLPFARLLSRPRNKKKVWDIHLAIRESLLPEALKKTFIENGLYYLARLKRVPEGHEERFAVFTVQGVNAAKEGREFYKKLCKWLRAIHIPTCDIKLEITTAMELYNSPKSVPPTIDHIKWI